MVHSILFITRTLGRVVDEYEKGIIKGLVRFFGKDFVLYKEIGRPEPLPLSTLIHNYITIKQIDLIICIGSISSKEVFEATKSYRKPPPVIFSGVLDPVEMGLIASLHDSCNHLTGVMMEGITDVIPAKLVLRAYPNLRNLMIPYRPNLQGAKQSLMRSRLKNILKNAVSRSRCFLSLLIILTSKNLSKKR